MKPKYAYWLDHNIFAQHYSKRYSHSYCISQFLQINLNRLLIYVNISRQKTWQTHLCQLLRLTYLEVSVMVIENIPCNAWDRQHEFPHPRKIY